ncbi:MAG: tRNA (adenosine(37)-N6)-threonylcarbamoyltransferase complex ATPase subunit type 1 TsaE [Clostridiales bacterium]|nr:tRNA (adenosine(37)-N6)-threonylcarbamoyltransferase complex ATPase subunit type 1 TsaE [Clostridiales bacterium]
MIIDSFNPEDTFNLGVSLGNKAKPGEIFCINGNLGVGKTVFTQGFANGMGINEAVNSPTFTILQEYQSGRLPLYHFDVYRIADATEMEEIGYEDYFYGEGVCLIEWSELIREILPADITIITIDKDLDKGFDYRRIMIQTQKG